MGLKVFIERHVRHTLDEGAGPIDANLGQEQLLAFIRRGEGGGCTP